MFLVNSAMVDLQIGTAGLVALLGYAVVFVGLIALMVVILIEGKIAVSKNEKAEAPKAAAPAAAGSVPVNAPMPGTILDIKVKAGAAVKAGDVVMILEAMKMENEISAPQDGTIASIDVRKGDTVNSGDVLYTMG